MPGGFHRRLRNKQWGVALICGYFEQRTIPIRGSCTNSVTLTLVARRSRHFAGTRYLKRGLTSDGFGAQFTCFTGAQVQILTLRAASQSRTTLKLSTSSPATQVLSLLALLVQK